MGKVRAENTIITDLNYGIFFKSNMKAIFYKQLRLYIWSKET